MLFRSGALVGWILHALKGSAWVVKHFGELGFWRPVFIIFGSLGFLLGVAFIFFLKDKVDENDSRNEKVRRNENDRRDEKVRKVEKPPLIEGLKAFFCNPSALLASGGFIAIVIANNVYMSWAPKFVAEKFAAELGDKTAAVASAGNGTMLWHHVFAFAAIMAGGFLTDAFVKRFPRFRLLVQGVALFLGAPMLVWFGFAPNLISTWVAVAAYGVFRGFFEVNTHASLFDVVVPKYRSTAVGLMTMLAFFLGALAPVLMGYLYDAWGLRGFEVGFAAIGGIYALGGALMLISLFFTFKRDRVTE